MLLVGIPVLPYTEMAMMASSFLGASNDTFHRQTTVRQFPYSQPLRPNLKRGSPLALVSTINNKPSGKSKQSSVGDSSDDEGAAPLLSAEAEELLGVRSSTSVKPSSNTDVHALKGVGAHKAAGEPSKSENLLRSRPTLHNQTTSPAAIRSGSPRIIRLNGVARGSANLRRSASTSSMQGGSPNVLKVQFDLETPAPRQRLGNAQIDTKVSAGISHTYVQSELGEEKDTEYQDRLINTDGPDVVRDAVVQMGSLTANKTKSEDLGPQGSLRIKRVGSVTGRYLSGPARRGMIRRHSEEEQSPLQEMALSGDEHRSRGSPKDVDEGLPVEVRRPMVYEIPEAAKTGVQRTETHVRFVGEPRVTSESENALLEPAKVVSQPRSTHSAISSASNGSSSRRLQPVFKVPPLPALPSRHDQENEPPPTFKRNKPNGLDLLEKPRKISILHDDKMLANTPSTISPARKPLGPRSQNTPLRAAPPPPKMTVLDTVTATAGAASASQSKKKRNYISVNGKLFTRMDCIGRGGSAKVYRVMAENYKVFALKRVSLEDVDELAIRGYKGEIELLRKLENEDRVIRLFDYEINDERQTLSILMEMGESDLSRVLNFRLNAENAKFDISFTRYFWKEMLECVQAVHQHDVVHSDLKPANFLLVQGRLKLIDFGIANAIQDDTVNVHREQQIGTPNYMSPEALIDANAVSGLPSTAGKIMKLGKPSDVWSLGCILYQMVYGKPPFAHITNQMQRVMAIPNPSHVIQYPSSGVGGATVPTGLIVVLRNCLNRNLAKRPTVEELLGDSDSFLHPDVQIAKTVPVNEELLARLQHSIIKHIQDRGIPSEAELSTWPARYFASIKAAVEEGRA